MKVNEFQNGVFIKANDCKTPFAALILGGEISEFNKQGGGKERKYTLILDVAGNEKKLTLNKTSMNALVGAWGDDDDLWKGKRIIVYYDPTVAFGGKIVGGVRIKLPGVLTAAEQAMKQQAAIAAMFAEDAPAPPAAGREPGEDDEPAVM